MYKIFFCKYSVNRTYFYGNNNLKLSSDSIKACAKNKNKIKKLSPERIQNEFFKILNSSNSHFIINIMRKIKILDLLFGHEVKTKIFKKTICTNCGKRYKSC